jgi:hypothetical protein
MPEYLILKLEGDDPRDATLAAHVISDVEPDDTNGLKGVIAQGFKSDGRYAILDWSARVEADLAVGPAQVSGVEDGKARAEAVEAAQAAEVAEAEAAKG